MDSTTILNEDVLTALGFKPSNGEPFSKWIDEFEGCSLFIDITFHFAGIAIFGKTVWTTCRIKTVGDLTRLYNALTVTENFNTSLTGYHAIH